MRFYTVSTTAFTFSATQDAITVYGAANKIVKVHAFGLSCPDKTLAVGQDVAVTGKYLPATVTAGSAGAAATPAKRDPGDAAATFTARANDTTPASTNGTALTHYAGGFHLFQGLHHVFTEPVTVISGTAFAINLPTAPTGSVTLSAWALCSEEG